MSDADYRRRLIAAREALGLSIREMAERLLTPRQTYEQWERGARRTPGIAVMAAEALTRSTKRRKTRSHDSYSARVVALLDGTMTAQEVADRLGVTRSTVYKAATAARERGEIVAFRRKRAAFTRPHGYSGRIAAALTGEWTVAEIAERLSVTRNAVYKTAHLARARGESVDFRRARRGPQGGRPKRNADNAARDRQISEALRAGETLRVIAARFGVSPEAVRIAGRRLGIASVRSREAVRQKRAERAAEKAAEKAAARAAANAARATALDTGERLVRAGSSIQQAAIAIGQSPWVLSRHLARRGVESAHGRWSGKGLAARRAAGARGSSAP